MSHAARGNAPHRLAIVVTFSTNGMEASHVPMLLDPQPAPFCNAHIARINAVAGGLNPSGEIDERHHD